MSEKLSVIVFASCFLATMQASAQCEFIPFDEAQRVLGNDITDLSGEDVSTQCFFLSNSTNAMLIIQMSNREYYHNVTLQQPFEFVDIGEEGRLRVEENGAAAVQFIQGDISVTMSVRPVIAGEASYRDVLFEVTARVAERIIASSP